MFPHSHYYYYDLLLFHLSMLIIIISSIKCGNGSETVRIYLVFIIINICYVRRLSRVQIKSFQAGFVNVCVRAQYIDTQTLFMANAVSIAIFNYCYRIHLMNKTHLTHNRPEKQQQQQQQRELYKCTHCR